MNLDNAIFNINRALELIPNDQKEASELKRIARLNKHINAYDLIEVSKLLNLSLDQLVSKRLSSGELSSQIKKEESWQKKYLVLDESFARKKTIFTISKYLDYHFGERFVDGIHSDLGLSRNHLHIDTHNQKVSPILIMDFFMALQRLMVDKSVFRYMANILSSQSVPQSIKSQFKGLSGEESLDLFTNIVLKKNFDNLFRYSFEGSKDDELLVRVNPERDNHSYYTKDVIGNKALCNYKIGVFESFLNISGIEDVIFYKESTCLYDGGSCCQYHFRVSKMPKECGSLH